MKRIEEVHEGIDDRDFKMRFQTYAYRDSPPSTVFASLYAGFTAARQTALVVGVNILGPENGVIAIRDYRLHMQMFRFLRERFPEVAIAGPKMPPSAEVMYAIALRAGWPERSCPASGSSGPAAAPPHLVKS